MMIMVLTHSVELLMNTFQEAIDDMVKGAANTRADVLKISEPICYHLPIQFQGCSFPTG
jgi:hypothetical protein